MSAMEEYGLIFLNFGWIAVNAWPWPDVFNGISSKKFHFHSDSSAFRPHTPPQ
jgi:hypothetical protein